ncbi:MAG TPA: hypothetical protein VG651_13815 [Stellaceae bacterium]|nr:hypothetical protein [Stellaceae bacterium]
MTQLPGVATAVVADAKITGYLLDPAHSDQAAGKAKFFQAHGFSAADWMELKKALLDHPRANAVAVSATTPFGEKYEVRCSIATPDGRSPCIVSIWIIEPPDPGPRFVTAYPYPHRD